MQKQNSASPLLAAHGLSLDFPKRFFLKVNKTDSCWLWDGAVRDTGYSKVTCNGRRGPSMSGQKAAWLMFNGEIPKDMELMNACPEHCKTCVNPNHWRLGKHSEIKLLREMSHPNVSLTFDQCSRLETILKQSGLTLAGIEALRTASYVTPDWMIDQGFSANFANRWYAKVRQTDTCWIWDGCRNSDGYGFIGINTGTDIISAHKASYMMFKGPIPENRDVLHHCAPNKDCPSCVNPAHLSVGTASENTEQAVRQHYSLFKKFWNSKLTREQVDEIRKQSAAGLKRREVAGKFGITASHVSDIVNFHVWKDPK
jgi:hypothetical protein